MVVRAIRGVASVKKTQAADRPLLQGADEAQDLEASNKGNDAVFRYTAPLSPEDAALDARWRAAFGQPLPLLGAGDIVRTILADQTAKSPKSKR